MSNKDWYKEWFASGLYLENYSHRDKKDAEQALDLILSNVDIPAGGEILDAACGAGRHAAILASKGFRVTAFDLSLPLLEQAKINTAAYPDVELVNADLRTFASCKNFDLAVNLFTSFGYFETDEENFRFFRNALDFIKPGGYVAMDYMNTEYVKNNLVPYSEKKVNGKIFYESRKISNGRVKKEIRVDTGNGKEAKFYESVKLYSAEEIIGNMEKLGYRVVRTFGGYEGKTFEKQSSERIILILKR